jgi:VIT1/CCC1 family predicted Fe2+/Mn2+ transporter
MTLARGSQRQLWVHRTLSVCMARRDPFHKSVLTSVLIGGLIPMLPYFVIDTVIHALFVSIGITAVILLVFGYIKDWFTIRTTRAGIRGAWQTLLVGALAAGASYGIVRAIDSSTQ